MAERLGVTHPCVSHWENGRRPIPKMAVKLLAVIEKTSVVAVDKPGNSVNTSHSRSHVANGENTSANGKAR
jgi:DNA-binding transcriptional regulator YdaS (Cro superfamily)